MLPIYVLVVFLDGFMDQNFSLLFKLFFSNFKTQNFCFLVSCTIKGR